jgi:hypothetical protein
VIPAGAVGSHDQFVTKPPRALEVTASEILADPIRGWPLVFFYYLAIFPKGRKKWPDCA